jgi:hypothetical protein
MCWRKGKNWFQTWTWEDWGMLIFFILILTLLGVNVYEESKNPDPVNVPSANP